MAQNIVITAALAWRWAEALLTKFIPYGQEKCIERVSKERTSVIKENLVLSSVACKSAKLFQDAFGTLL